MTSDEIRQNARTGKFRGVENYAGSFGSLPEIGIEIAAQLADLNASLKEVAKAMRERAASPESEGGR